MTSHGCFVKFGHLKVALKGDIPNKTREHFQAAAMEVMERQDLQVGGAE